MTTKMASISLEGAFHASYQMVGSRGYQYRGVKHKDGTTEMDQVMALEAANASAPVIAGVLQNDVLEDEYAKVVYFGPTKAKANADGINRDDLLECIWNDDSDITDEDKMLNGTFKKITLTEHIAEGEMIAGIALEDADQYEIFKMFLLRRVAVYES